jgi:glucose/arabinose dehydrogenase
MTQTILSKVLRLTVAGAAFFSATSFAAESKPTNAPAVKPLRREGTKWDLMEHGPFLSSYMDAQPKINKAVSINLGNGATVCFDTEMCKLAMGWVGGFVKLPTGRDGLEGMPKPGGTNIVFTTPAGPGWADADGNFSDSRPEFKGKKYGPLPKEHAKWKGIYLDGDDVTLSYTVGKARVLEKYTAAGNTFTRSLDVTPGGVPLTTIICEAKGDATVEPDHIFLSHGDQTTVVSVSGTGGKLELGTNKCVLLKFDGKRAVFARVFIWSGPSTSALSMHEMFGKLFVSLPTAFAQYTRSGGKPRWGEPLLVPGKVNTNTTESYVVDTITIPETNRFNSWIRCSGLDFFANGARAALCSVSGDVWLLSNIDDKLDRVTWKRYATGLFQPLGLKIVEDKVYVLGRDQITRLHDLNNDGEADFYENFNNDVGAFQEYHEFALDLQVDSQGNFYFAKGGNLGDAKHPHNGCVIKVSKDGSKLESFACGLRAPNGMGMGPHDEISVSDNQGNWVPASRFSIVKPGGFYGHVNNAYRTPAPKSYDNPVCWMPYPYPDNSSGGQVWVTSDKWGPFQGDMLHMSYGQCLLLKVLLDKVDGEYQGGVVKFPLKFDSGIMRAVFNKKDGQLYVCGLNVWQSNGARKGAVHRVRYTGKPVHMPAKLHANKRGVALTFTSPLDESTATDPANWNVEEWDYKWSSNYGSPEYKHSAVANREEFEKAGTSIPIELAVPEAQARGHDKVEVKSVKLSTDKKTAFLEMATHPVMQMKISANLKTADGTVIKPDVWNSIWRVAEN